MVNITSELLQDVIRKIRIQRGLHAVFEQRTKSLSVFLKVINISLSSLVATLAFSDTQILRILLPFIDSSLVLLYIGGIGFLLFIGNILIEVFSIHQHHQEHRMAIELFTSLLREIKEKLQDSDVNQSSLAEIYNQRYLQVVTNTRKFTNRQYSKSHPKYVRSNCRRLVLKKNPFIRPWKIREAAIANVDAWHEKESQI